MSTVVPPGVARSRAVEMAASGAVGVIAVAAAVLLLAAEGPVSTVLGVLAWSAAAAGTAVLLYRRRGSTALTSHASARLVLVLGSAALLLDRRPGGAAWIWIAAGLLLLAVVSEPTLRTLLGQAAPVATRLPGVPDVPALPFRPDLVVWAGLAATVLGALLAAAGAPGRWWLVATATVAVGTAATGVAAARAVLASQRATAGVRDALKAYRPEFVVYYAALHGARYQLGMWLPYLERLDRRFVVITRNDETVPEILALTTAPVLVPQTTSATATLGQLVVPSMKAAFYVQGDPGNLGLQRVESLTHVWLNHGDSDKKANFSAQHATFDKVFVAGQQGVERYAAHGVKLRPDQFEVVGRPQIERIEVRDGPPPPGSPRTVLYAPTWVGGRPGTSYSSLHLGPRIVAALLERGVTVVFRPHPLSRRDPGHLALIREIGRTLDADRAASGRPHVWGPQAEQDWDIPACFNVSDALVTDVSSVASDFLASGKPLAMVAIRHTGRQFLKEAPMARVAYVIERDLSTLDRALDDLLGPDPLADARLAYRTRCLGESLGARAADGFLAAAGALLDARR